MCHGIALNHLTPILILCFYYSVFWPKIYYSLAHQKCICFLPFPFHMSRVSYSAWFNRLKNTLWGTKPLQFLIMQLFLQSQSIQPALRSTTAHPTVYPQFPITQLFLQSQNITPALRSTTAVPSVTKHPAITPLYNSSLYGLPSIRLISDRQHLLFCTS
jgi:hypothetical protein